MSDKLERAKAEWEKIKETCFVPFENDEESDEDVNLFINKRQHEALCDNDWDYAEGATRGVVIGDNFVFKFNLYPNDEDGDYCESEKAVYDAAVEWDLQDWFAWTDVVDTYCNTKVYAMDRCGVDSDELYDAATSWVSDRDGYDCNDLEDEDLVDYAAECSAAIRDRSELKEFLHTFTIHDLHEGNWGWKGNNLVLTDYASYNVNVAEIISNVRARNNGSSRA